MSNKVIIRIHEDSTTEKPIVVIRCPKCERHIMFHEETTFCPLCFREIEFFNHVVWDEYQQDYQHKPNEDNEIMNINETELNETGEMETVNVFKKEDDNEKMETGGDGIGSVDTGTDGDVGDQESDAGNVLPSADTDGNSVAGNTDAKLPEENPANVDTKSAPKKQSNRRRKKKEDSAGVNMTKALVVQPKKSGRKIPTGPILFYTDKPTNPKDHRGVITVAYKVSQVKTKKRNGFNITFGVSYCSPGDVYLKTEGKENGRDKAIKRMNDERTSTTVFSTSFLGYRVRQVIFAGILANGSMPYWAKDQINKQLADALILEMQLQETKRRNARIERSKHSDKKVMRSMLSTLRPLQAKIDKKYANDMAITILKNRAQSSFNPFGLSLMPSFKPFRVDTSLT